MQDKNNKPKFTPGPWRVTIVGHGFGLNYNAIRVYRGGSQEPIGMASPDLNLIAASPDMYEALELIINDNRLMNALNTDQVRAVMDSLAKARGES